MNGVVSLFPPCSVANASDRGVACQRMDLLLRLARLLADDPEPARALAQALKWLERDQQFNRAAFVLLDEDEDEIAADITADDVPADAGARMRYRLGEGVIGRVVAENTPICLRGIKPEDGFLNRSQLRHGVDLAKLVFFCVPVSYRGRAIGALSADRSIDETRDPEGDMRLLAEVAHLVAPFIQRRRLEERLAAFLKLPRSSNERLIGRSPAIETVKRLAARVAMVDTSVLITGETGTGKGVLASVIHDLSTRRSRPFIEVNCGAIPDTLIESELFGHERGAFTGATTRRAGVFERAAGGTVFLDEIGELPLPAQTRLLRVLQTRRFERVGGSETLVADVRIIAATNRDLESEVLAKRFRADLWYRLDVFPIHMPPLRERGKADIMLLADAFAERIGKAMGKTIARFDTPAIDMLTSYHWPGNVRELENVIERAVVLAEGETIHGHHLPPSLQMNRYRPHPEAAAEDFATRVANFEICLITEALKDASGNQSEAARRLGMSKRQMQCKIRHYGIDWRRFR